MTYDVSYESDVKDYVEVPTGLTKAGDNAYYIAKQTLTEGAKGAHKVSIKDYEGNTYDTTTKTITVTATTTACNPPSAVAMASGLEEFIYKNNENNKEFTLPKLTTTPTACRNNGMKYILERNSDMPGTWTTDALNTDMDTPKFTQVKEDFVLAKMRKSYTHKMYIETILGSKITTDGKFFEFKTYIQDPDCDSPTMTAPSKVSWDLKHNVAADALDTVFDAWTAK